MRTAFEGHFIIDKTTHVERWLTLIPKVPEEAVAKIRAPRNWTAETAAHTLRIIFGGMFTRFPKARLLLEHMGETLPYSSLAPRQAHAGLHRGQDNQAKRTLKLSA